MDQSTDGSSLIRARDRRVWLSGERFNLAYLYDPDTGEVVEKVRLPGQAGATAGMGYPCAGSFAAIYVTHDEEVVLQVGMQRFPLDGLTRARHRRRMGGVISFLEVGRSGQEKVHLRQLKPVSAFLRHVDPTYDELDELNNDYLADIADVVNSGDRIKWVLEVKDPDAGPWEALC